MLLSESVRTASFRYALYEFTDCTCMAIGNEVWLSASHVKSEKVHCSVDARGFHVEQQQPGRGYGTCVAGLAGSRVLRLQAWNR